MAPDHEESRSGKAADDRDRRVELRIPFATLLKITLFARLVVIAIQLWPLIVTVIVAALLAVMLDPIAGWFEHHGVGRGVAIAFIAIALFGSVVAFVFAVVPAMVSQCRISRRRCRASPPACRRRSRRRSLSSTDSSPMRGGLSAPLRSSSG